MQTHFTLEQLADSGTREADKILRACVHCGFCTATCPTYTLLGDELDSPRGRIYLIKDMLENDRPATADVVKHVDRCLSCLSCMTTCPSGVNYMHLIDHARHHIERSYKRPLLDRVERRLLGHILPRPGVFKAVLALARIVRPMAFLLPRRLRAPLRLIPERIPVPKTQATAPLGAKPIRRVALLTGCVQKILDPAINEATIRLLVRHGCEVVMPKGSGCCGALNHHLGQDEGLDHARANIRAWMGEIKGQGLDAIVINASGCGTTVKDYGFMFRDDPELAEAAKTVSALARDISELMAEIGIKPPGAPSGLKVAYHAACSLQHGQKVRQQPKDLLKAAGFVPLDIPESHLCCGSAGTYNLLQPDLAEALRDRKAANIESIRPDVVAAGNIGCIAQIASGTRIPVVHTAELLDWATGGPEPGALSRAT